MPLEQIKYLFNIDMIGDNNPVQYCEASDEGMRGFALFEEINNAGTTVIMVTHDKNIVNAMSKRVITLNRGVVVSDEENGVYIDED